MDLILFLKTVVLGIVEGVTEFLPISSTGHLLVAERMLKYSDPGDVFTVFIQLGAILAVLIISWNRVIPPVLALGRKDEVGDKARKFALAVILAMIPAVVIGAPVDKWAEKHHFVTLEVVAASFAIGGLAILIIERMKHRNEHNDATSLPWKIALIIGFCQVLAALFPGTSRSGATIMGALLCGVTRVAATEFSFFLAIPVMIGATGWKLFNHRHDLTSERWAELGVGFIVSFIVAWFVIRWLIKFVSTHDFKSFGWYRIVAGLLIAGALAANLFPAPVDEDKDTKADKPTTSAPLIAPTVATGK